MNRNTRIEIMLAIIAILISLGIVTSGDAYGSRMACSIPTVHTNTNIITSLHTNLENLIKDIKILKEEEKKNIQ